MKPKQWHVYIVDLEPRIGTKPGKQRPCVCVQPTAWAELGLPSSVILPLTTKIKGKDAAPLRVTFPANTCGLQESSEALVDQILAWDHSLFRKDLGEIPLALQEDLKNALKEFLAI